MEENNKNLEENKELENKKEVIGEEKKKEAPKEKAKEEVKEKKVAQKSEKKPEKPEKKVENKAETKKEEKDATFKKVANKSEKKKKIDEIEQKGKKNHGIAKAVLILVMIFIAAYCIFFVRNLIILNNISKKIAEYDNVTGFSYTTVSKNDGEVVESKIQYYKKDNIERFDYTRDELTMTWWYDSDTNEKIISTPVSKKATVSNVEGMETVRLPIESVLKSKDSIAYMSLGSLIYSEEYNSKDCYVIDLGDNNKTWIDKETGLVVKREHGFDKGTTEYTDVNLDFQGEVYKPDLTGYEITYDNVEK